MPASRGEGRNARLRGAVGSKAFENMIPQDPVYFKGSRRSVGVAGNPCFGRQSWQDSSTSPAARSPGEESCTMRPLICAAALALAALPLRAADEPRANTLTPKEVAD